MEKVVLKQMKSHRKENRKVYFVDDTWVNAGHTRSKIWVDNSFTSSRPAFFNELSIGLKNSSGKF